MFALTIVRNRAKTWLHLFVVSVRRLPSALTANTYQSDQCSKATNYISGVNPTGLHEKEIRFRPLLSSRCNRSPLFHTDPMAPSRSLCPYKPDNHLTLFCSLYIGRPLQCRFIYSQDVKSIRKDSRARCNWVSIISRLIELTATWTQNSSPKKRQDLSHDIPGIIQSTIALTCDTAQDHKSPLNLSVSQHQATSTSPPPIPTCKTVH